MIKQYGLQISEIKDPNAYVLGALTSLPKIVLRPDGDWSGFLPTFERQHNNSYDTYGCTVFGTLNAVEILIKRVLGKEENYSERFNYNCVPINPPGADPHEVAESIRKVGVIDEALLPMTPAYERYTYPRPMSAPLLAKGQTWPYELKHEYVWQTPQTSAMRREKIKEALQYSPLGVSVTAWTEQNGLYVDNGRPNTHWCVLIKDNGRGYDVFDSYDRAVKTLSYDHNIQICKRYYLAPRTPEAVESWWAKVIDLITKVKKTLLWTGLKKS